PVGRNRGRPGPDRGPRSCAVRRELCMMDAPAGGRQPVPPSVQAAASWSWRLLLIGAALAVLLWLLNELKVVVVPISVALLLTVLLAPFVGWLVRRGLPRVAAVGISLVGLVVLVAGLL